MTSITGINFKFVSYSVYELQCSDSIHEDDEQVDSHSD